MLIINKLCFAVPERTLYLIGKPLIVLFLIFIKTLYSLYITVALKGHRVTDNRTLTMKDKNKVNILLKLWVS